LLGLLTKPPGEWLRGGGASRYEGDIDKRVAARALARGQRRFADADRIRDELASEGIILEDRPDGTTDWRRA
jgi:cysteinyl-tRNA synthetase